MVLVERFFVHVINSLSPSILVISCFPQPNLSSYDLSDDYLIFKFASGKTNRLVKITSKFFNSVNILMQTKMLGTSLVANLHL